eukprot:gene13836-13952_t
MNWSGLAAVCLALVVGVNPLAAQQRILPETTAQVKYSFAPLVKKVQPAVVNVYASRRDDDARNPLFDDPFFKHFFGLDNGQRPGGPTAQSLGSGVIVDRSGLVVTNHHVIEGMTDVKVAMGDKREYEAEIVLRDPRSDLAVLRLKGGTEFPVMEMGDSDALEVGDFVIAIGNPFGVGQTVTQGIVSALARTQASVSDYQFFVQTDAAINPGNSGGAMVDMSGRLVGINSAIYSKSGGSNGIGFAIPVNMVRVVVAAAKGGVTKVRRPWVGAIMQALTKDVAENLGLDRASGALITNIQAKSPAADAGLKVGDVITSVDGQAIDDPEAFGFRLGTKTLGGTASLAVIRNSKTLVVPIKLLAAPEEPARMSVKVNGSSPLTGTTLVNISPAVAEDLSIEAASGGVVVADIEDGSVAAELGVQKGDIILALNGAKIAATSDIAAATAGRHNYWKLTINRHGQVITSVFGG